MIDSAAALSFPKLSIQTTRHRVRHQGIWDTWLPELREDLANLVCLIMRRVTVASSALEDLRRILRRRPYA